MHLRRIGISKMTLSKDPSERDPRPDGCTRRDGVKAAEGEKTGSAYGRPIVPALGSWKKRKAKSWIA